MKFLQFKIVPDKEIPLNPFCSLEENKIVFNEKVHNLKHFL